MTKLLSIVVLLVTILSVNCVRGEEYCNYKLINSNGYNMKPLMFPVRVSTNDPTLEFAISESIEWWNESLQYYWVRYCEDHLLANCNKFPKFISHVENRGIVRVREVSDEGQDNHGSATNWTTVGGTITYSDVQLISGKWSNRVLIHELGHAVFGLAHDCDEKYEGEGWESLMVPFYTKENDYYLMEHDAELIFRDFILLKSSLR